MQLQFPQVKDLPLVRPPLKEVICQVRFPPILAIGRGQPVEFQEAIRQRFPELAEEQNYRLLVAGSPRGQAANAEIGGRTFHFRTAKEDSFVSLTADAYAISTSHYTVWDAFASDLRMVHDAVMTSYSPPYAKRIGLRFVNQFDAERTGCAKFEELRDFFRPALVALMATDAWRHPEEAVSQVLLADEEEHLAIRIAARVASGQPPVFILDFDYYQEGSAISLDGLIERCARYHDVIYRAFRWSIRPEKLDVFEPVASGA